MILVDVYVPSVDKVYDFQLNENTPVNMIIEEICEMVSQKEHTVLNGKIEDMLLCEKGSERILLKEDTLYSSGVRTGKSLILV